MPWGGGRAARHAPQVCIRTLSPQPQPQPETETETETEPEPEPKPEPEPGPHPGPHSNPNPNLSPHPTPYPITRPACPLASLRGAVHQSKGWGRGGGLRSILPPLLPPCVFRFALSLLSGVPSAFIPASLPPTLSLPRPCATPATRPLSVRANERNGLRGPTCAYSVIENEPYCPEVSAEWYWYGLVQRSSTGNQNLNSSLTVPSPNVDTPPTRCV